MAIIRVAHVTKCFGTFTALDDVSFDVKRGTVFGIVGAPGAGKSVLLRLLTGELPPTAGHVEVNGIDPAMFSPGRVAPVGYLPQDAVVRGVLAVAESLDASEWEHGLAAGAPNPWRDELVEPDACHGSTVRERARARAQKKIMVDRSVGLP